MKASIEVNQANFHMIVPDPHDLSSKERGALARETKKFLDTLSQKERRSARPDWDENFEYPFAAIGQTMPPQKSRF